MPSLTSSDLFVGATYSGSESDQRIIKSIESGMLWYEGGETGIPVWKFLMWAKALVAYPADERMMHSQHLEVVKEETPLRHRDFRQNHTEVAIRKRSSDRHFRIKRRNQRDFDE